MVRLTFHLGDTAPVTEPVNLAFAAAAAARASWASPGASHDQPQVPLATNLATWGAPGDPLSDAVDEVEAIWKQATAMKALQASQAAGASGPARVPAAPLLASPTADHGPFVSHPPSRTLMAIPRNSMMMRAGKDYLPTASSLPPAMAFAPSAGEVADIVQSRRLHGLFTAQHSNFGPDDSVVRAPPRPKRSASFSQLTLDTAAKAPGAEEDEDGGGGGASGNSTNRRASCTNHHLTSGLLRGYSSAVMGTVGGMPPTGGPSSSICDGGGDEGSATDDGDDVDGDDGGGGGRAGCLVLPVLRTLLAMQDSSASPWPGRGGGGGGGGNGGSSSPAAATAALLGHSVAAGPSGLSRAPSQHALRSSTSQMQLHASGLSRQGSVTAMGVSPPRRGHGGGGGHGHGHSHGLRPSPLAVPGPDYDDDDDDDGDGFGGGRAPLARTKSYGGASLSAAMASPGPLRAGHGGLRSSTATGYVSVNAVRAPGTPMVASPAASSPGAAAVAVVAALAVPSTPPGGPGAIQASPKGRFSWGASKLAGGKWPWSGGVSSTSSGTAAATAAAVLSHNPLSLPGGSTDLHGAASPNAAPRFPVIAEQAVKRRQALTEPPAPPPVAAAGQLIKGLAAAASSPSPSRRAGGEGGSGNASPAAAMGDLVGLGTVMGSGLKRALR